ncbi:MAG: hypothetical protein L3K09_03875 [Thermoplasmata archaeon]|nr:hypothetical protein [Thermoplasmata archaeon]
MPDSGPPSDIAPRLAALVHQGKILESEGLPFPWAQVQKAVEEAVQQGAYHQGLQVLKRAELLYARASQDWSWVRELLRRVDELRQMAQAVGLDVQALESRLGNARKQLQATALSAGSLEKAAAGASLALAVLNDTLPKYCIQEAQKLGVSIRGARNRGEEAEDATKRFSLLLGAIQDGHLPTMTARLLDVRKAVGRIPRAPAVPGARAEEEEEILLEARQLAGRLRRIKGKARDAQSAARLMTQVRAALSEDRRFGTPEEEIEALWTEVDRLTQERKANAPGSPESDAVPPVAEESTGYPEVAPAPTRSRPRARART